jgi:hypothetical protein
VTVTPVRDPAAACASESESQALAACSAGQPEAGIYRATVSPPDSARPEQAATVTVTVRAVRAHDSVRLAGVGYRATVIRRRRRGRATRRPRHPQAGQWAALG